MPAGGESLLGRVVASIASTGEPSPSGRAQKSILGQAAASYARKPTGAESTIPTGFDPRAASLFEAVVEASFLVANADGVFDDKERKTFESVVHEACQDVVQMGDLRGLVSDLCDLLEEDGVERRIEMVSSVVGTREQKLEVLRISALMAHVSGGVDDRERDVMARLANAFELEADLVQSALDQAEAALGS